MAGPLLHITGSIDAGPADRKIFNGSRRSCELYSLRHEIPTSAEPPVPAGLGELSAPLQALIEFLGIDEALVEVAASASAPLDAGPGRKELAEWIQNLPEEEKSDLLVTAAVESGERWKVKLLTRFQRESAAYTSLARATLQPRAVRDLRAAAGMGCHRRRGSAPSQEWPCHIPWHPARGPT
jgi:hypothetical protein